MPLKRFKNFNFNNLLRQNKSILTNFLQHDRIELQDCPQEFNYTLLVARLFFAHKYVDFSYIQFFRKVVLKVSVVTLVAIIPSFVLYGIANGFWVNILNIVAEVLSTGFIIFLLGLNRTERLFILNIVKKRISK